MDALSENESSNILLAPIEQFSNFFPSIDSDPLDEILYKVSGNVQKGSSSKAAGIFDARSVHDST